MNRTVHVCCFFLLLTATSVVAAPREPLQWQFATTAPRDTPPDERIQWAADAERDSKSDLWMRARLASDVADPQLVFRGYVEALDVFVEGRRVYSFRDADAVGRLRVHAVPLENARAGDAIYIHVPRAPDGATLTTPLLVPSSELATVLSELAYRPLLDGLFDIVIGLLLIGVALIAIFASGVSRRSYVLALRYFGIFTLLYGARLLTDSFLPAVLGYSPDAAEYATYFITYIITIPAWLLPLQLIGPGWKSTLRLQVVAFMVFAPVAVISDIVTREAGSLGHVNNILVIIGAVNILANLLILQRGGTIELRVILIGSVAFLLLALNNNIAGLGLIPRAWGNETVGFLLFITGLGFAATRGFLRGERERVTIQQELETAREIQRSILPTSTPSLDGLRMHVGYVPASSVGGDMYDFRQVDAQHCGVLVADVAGHGVPAALVASMVKIAVSSQSHLAADPAAMLAELSRTLRREVRRAFVTATCLWFDLAERTVTVCNGGHPAPLLLRDGEFTELGRSGVVLGRFAQATYASDSFALRRGDRLVAFTDGIVEARDRNDELFGEEQLKGLLLSVSSDDSETVAGAVLDAVLQWRGPESADADDLTILVFDVL